MMARFKKTDDRTALARRQLELESPLWHGASGRERAALTGPVLATYRPLVVELSVAGQVDFDPALRFQEGRAANQDPRQSAHQNAARTTVSDA